MSTVGLPRELHLLFFPDGSLVTYQEKEKPWAALVGFSSAQQAADFCYESELQGCETGTIDAADHASIASLIRQAKSRAIRYLLLDLDYRKGGCVQVEFEGDGFGAARVRQLVPPHAH